MSPYHLTFKALSDETRREILNYLKEGSMTAGEIAEKFNMTKPSISHHLNILKQADLISDERRGQNIVYTLNTSVVEDLLSWFFDLLRKDGAPEPGDTIQSDANQDDQKRSER